MVIEHYEPGERVLAFTGQGKYSDSANWKPGVVSRDEPYPHARTGGAFVMWDLPRDTPWWVSRGGWHPQNCLRRVEG